MTHVLHAALLSAALAMPACKSPTPRVTMPGIEGHYTDHADFFRGRSEADLHLARRTNDTATAYKHYDAAVENSQKHLAAVLFLSSVHAARARDFDRALGMSDRSARLWPENAELLMLRFLLGVDEAPGLVPDMLAKLRVSEEASAYTLAMADAMEGIPINEDAMVQFAPHQQSFLRFLQDVARTIDEGRPKTPSDDPSP